MPSSTWSDLESSLPVLHPRSGADFPSLHPSRPPSLCAHAARPAARGLLVVCLGFALVSVAFGLDAGRLLLSGVTRRVGHLVVDAEGGGHPTRSQMRDTVGVRLGWVAAAESPVRGRDMTDAAPRVPPLGIAFDTETTSKKPYDARIVELAAVVASLEVRTSLAPSVYSPGVVTTRTR